MSGVVNPAKHCYPRCWAAPVKYPGPFLFLPFFAKKSVYLGESGPRGRAAV